MRIAPVVYENVLYVHSGDEDLMPWFNAVADPDGRSEEEICFSGILKTPPDLRGKEIAEWRLEHWGTRLEPAVHSYTQEEHWLEYHFETLNYPPKPWLEAIGKLFPNFQLVLCYVDEDNTHTGDIIIEDGCIADESESTSDDHGI